MDKPKVYETFIERSNRSGGTNLKKLKIFLDLKTIHIFVT